jgi:hypothetical protein
VVRGRARTAALGDQVQVLLLRIVWRDERCEERRDDEASDEDAADDRARIPDQPLPGLTPEATRRLELDLAGLELDYGDGITTPCS